MPDQIVTAAKPVLTAEQKSAVHRLASEVVAAAIHQRTVNSQILDAVSAFSADGTGAATVMGAFVTLNTNGRLRACCGTVGNPMSLLQAVRHAAERTATEDHRFPPISPTEFSQLTLDITLLSDFEPLIQQGEERVAAVEVGTHGLKIVSGDQTGLLLPSVAVDAGWDSREFLNQVCRKAGLPVTSWMEADTQLLRFEGHTIEDKFDDSVLLPGEDRAAFDMTQSEVDALCRFAKANIMAQIQGAIPSCLGPECPDRSVNGIVVRLLLPGDTLGVTFSNFQVRAGLALQTTLLQLTQAAAVWLQSVQANQQSLSQMNVDCVVFADPAMHGIVGQSSVVELSTADRAIMVVEGQRRAWSFCGDKAVNELITNAAARIGNRADTASVYSFAVRSSATDISDSNVPVPQAGTPVRPPAVAGTFYPADAAQFLQVVNDCYAACTAPDDIIAASAVMVPHAGLRLSGRIAADVLNRIHIPNTVIILGPKHTRDGVDWAVAPHQTWQLPGCSVAADVPLAEKLAAQINGLELDAAAHAQEHSTEIILTLLARIAPKVNVVSIAMGGATFAQCQSFAAELAAVIRDLPEAPLLIISSDMHHFATDVENRRLDEMALAAMETGDPEELFHIVSSNNISMCGVIPAVIVMETLHAMQIPLNIRRIGYATSADAGGDTERVVGYAGVILAGD